MRMFNATTIASTMITLALTASGWAQPFRITVVDAETNRGVPMVELSTTNNITFITDSAGVIAFDEPGMMDRRVFFTVKSHGYTFPADGFGFTGQAVRTKRGGSITLKINRESTLR